MSMGKFYNKLDAISSLYILPTADDGSRYHATPLEMRKEVEMI